jgi:hypothetical protein
MQMESDRTDRTDRTDFYCIDDLQLELKNVPSKKAFSIRQKAAN